MPSLRPSVCPYIWGPWVQNESSYRNFKCVGNILRGLMRINWLVAPPKFSGRKVKGQNHMGRFNFQIDAAELLQKIQQPLSLKTDPAWHHYAWANLARSISWWLAVACDFLPFDHTRLFWLLSDGSSKEHPLGQRCKQDQILKTKTTIKIIRPRPRPPEVNKGTWPI